MMKKLTTISCVLLVLSACSGKPQIQTYHVKDDKQEIETFENAFKDSENLDEASGVFFDHQLVVSLQVKPFSKLRKEKITKSFEKEMKTLFPDHEVFVSSDLKITWELNKIIEKKPNEDELKKDLDEIQSLAKEET